MTFGKVYKKPQGLNSGKTDCKKLQGIRSTKSEWIM